MIPHCVFPPNGAAVFETLPIYLPNQGPQAHKLPATLVAKLRLLKGPNLVGFEALGTLKWAEGQVSNAHRPSTLTRTSNVKPCYRTSLVVSKSV